MPDSTSSRVAAALYLFSAATTSIHAALTVALHVGATAEDLLQLTRCALPLLGSGQLVAERAAKAVRRRGASPHVSRILSSLLINNIFAQASALRACMDAAGRAGMLGSFAEQCAPPQLLVAWLRTTAHALLSNPVGESLHVCLMAQWVH